MGYKTAQRRGGGSSRVSEARSKGMSAKAAIQAGAPATMSGPAIAGTSGHNVGKLRRLANH